MLSSDRSDSGPIIPAPPAPVAVPARQTQLEEALKPKTKANSTTVRFIARNPPDCLTLLKLFRVDVSVLDIIYNYLTNKTKLIFTSYSILSMVFKKQFLTL